MSVVTEPAAATRNLEWLRTVAVFIALAGLAMGYLVLLRTPAVGMFHDDGIYLVTAKALAEGQGYRISSIPGEPPQTKYPILFPWLLSLMWRAYPSFPANVLWLRLVPLGAMLIWLGLSWALLRRLGTSIAQAGIIVFLTALSPWVAFLSTTLMSETVFAALLAGVLLMITRVCEGDGRRFEPLLAGLLAGAAILTRVAGIAPAGAGVVVFLWSRRSVAAAQYLLGVLVTAVPWFWWAHYQNPIATSVDPYYSATNYASWNVLTSYSWAAKFDIIAANLFQAGLALLNIWKVSIPPVPLLPLALAIGGLALVAPAFWRTRGQPAVPIILAYCGIHIAWVWPFLRFAVPVAPFLLWFAFLGAGRSRRIGYIGALALFALGGVQVGAMVKQANEQGIVSPFTEVEDWNETARLLAWVSQNTPKDTVLTGNLDPAYYMFTGRKAIRAFSADPLLLFYDLRGQPENPLGSVNDFQKRLVSTRSDYLIMTAATGFAEVPHLNALVSELSHKCPGSLAPVATNVVPAHVIYRIDRRRLESHEGCRRHIRPEVN
jgi:hypothetical protein